MPEPDLLDPDIIAQLNGLRLQAQRIVDGFLTGSHRNPQGGSSIEFSEHREYTFGDDLRYLDWKAYGRSDRLYLKQFEDETNYSAMFCLDTSRSMAYQGPQSPWSKFACAQAITAAIAWLVINQGDAAGVSLFSDAVETWLPPAAYTGQLPQIIETLDSATPTGKTAVTAIYDELADRLQRRMCLIVVSDLLTDPQATLSGLRRLKHAGHDVLVFHLLDAAEVELPFQQMTQFRSLEDGQTIRTEPTMIRSEYQQEVTSFLRTLEHGCRCEGIDYLFLQTHESIGFVLSRFLANRARRVH